MVKIIYSIRQVLEKSDLAEIMGFRAVKLSGYNIQYIPTRSIKSQVMEDFMVEFSTPNGEEIFPAWVLLMDETSNVKGSGAEMVIEELYDLRIKKSLKFEFK